jgi:hypothetical protein
VISDDDNAGFYKLNGRIPWTDIAGNPSHYLSKRSQADSDYKLEDPSHMKSDAVNAWLKHWLRLQRRNKRPLVLKARSDKPSDNSPTPTVVAKGKGKKKAKYVESDDPDDPEQWDEDADGRSDVDQSATNSSSTRKGKAAEVRTVVLLPSPQSAALTRTSRRLFLASLADDSSYHKLLMLLHVAKASDKILVFT